MRALGLDVLFASRTMPASPGNDRMPSAYNETHMQTSGTQSQSTGLLIFVPRLHGFEPSYEIRCLGSLVWDGRRPASEISDGLGFEV